MLDLSGSYAIPRNMNQAHTMSRSASAQIEESQEVCYDYVRQF